MLKLINGIYSGWTGQIKVKRGQRTRKRVNGQRVENSLWETTDLIYKTESDSKIVLWDSIKGIDEIVEFLQKV